MKDEIYMQHRALGVPPAKSAQLAGVTLGYGKRLEQSPKGILLLDRFQKKAEEELEHTRGTVLRDLQAAYDMAKKMADLMAMVAAIREVAKVIGAYAPEKKQLEVLVHGAVTINQVRQMSDNELMQLAGAGGRIIEQLVDSPHRLKGTADENDDGHRSTSETH